MQLEGPFEDILENAAHIPVVSSVTDKNRVVLMSVPVNMAKEDVALILGQVEVTNNLGLNVGFGRYITRGISPTDVGGKWLVPANMDNITPGEHHRSQHFWAVDSDAEGTFYYNMVAYAVSSDGNGNLIVQQKYGKLVVMKFRREASTNPKRKGAKK